jgi:hypothetical protein
MRLAMGHSASVTERATVIDVPGLQWSAGASEPRVLMSELWVGIAFYAWGARPGVCPMRATCAPTADDEAW